MRLFLVIGFIDSFYSYYIQVVQNSISIPEMDKKNYVQLFKERFLYLSAFHVKVLFHHRSRILILIFLWLVLS